VTFAAGDLIGGRYRLDELIGTGGMGQVFRGVDTVLARPVAIKLVDAVESRRREEIMQGFLREARISAAIDHRNVVRILDFGTHGSTVPYMVMELLEGESLGDVLGRGDAMPFDWLLAIVTQVLDGLAAAHDAGIVHRDLKPENIYLVRDQGMLSPKILDFGISKFLDSTGTAQVTTKHGHVVGTPAYMSPEQARGVRHIDQRSDIYAMGVVLYELLCGEMPFYSENPGDLMLMIMTTEAKPLVERVPDVGIALSEVVARAMKKKPDERFQTVREMQKAVLASSQEVLGSKAVERLNARLRPISWRHESPQVETHSEAPPRRRPAAETEHLRRGEGAQNSRHQARRWVLPAVGAGVAMIAIGLGAIWFGRTSADPSPRFIVVRSEPVASAAAPASDSTPPSTPLSHTPESSSTMAPSAATRKPNAVAPSAPKTTAEILAESFRKQRAPVVACLNAHAAEAEAVPKLAVKFALSSAGRVERAGVSPAELSKTPMGACIESAVRAMSFPPQAQPISFEVPLTARKGG
jgi:serine/threonine-protein kinase